MVIPFYPAMTAFELANCKALPARMSFLACHFSPSGPGLSNVPERLMPGSVLILDDSIPFSDHHPELIGAQLTECIHVCQLQALVLDLQRPGDEKVRALADFLSRSLPCPVIAPPEYVPSGAGVLLPPCPLGLPLAKHIAPYGNRRIWLELAIDGTTLKITKNGCHQEPLQVGDPESLPHWDQTLLCRYRIEKAPDQISFLLHRTRQDLPKLLEEAAKLGIAAAIGLWQELK